MKYAKLAASALAPKRLTGGLCWRVYWAGCAALVAVFFLCAPAQAEDLHPRLETARDGHNLIAALHIAIPAEFHAYGHEPGEAGRPTTVALSVDGGRPLPVHYPQGAVQRDFYDPTATVNVYEGNVTFFASLPADAAGKPFVADMSMLLCSNRKCVPVNEQFAGIVPRDSPALEAMPWRIQWLEMHLQQYKGTVIAVTHDRYFLDNAAGWILELDRGEGIPWKGNYSSWLDQKSKRLAQEEKTESKRRKTLERELEWVRMAPKARQAKSKARLSAYDKLLNEDSKEKEEKLEIFIPNGPRLGNHVIDVQGVSKAYGDKVLFEDLTFSLPPAGIVGVIGPNGVGKTTLFKLIMGLETPDSGTFSVGDTVKVGYADQMHKSIDPEKSVYNVISEGNELMMLGGRSVNARAYVSRFNFSGADQEKLVKNLSGGERNRLHLALTLKEEANVLLLDEPTNDIDVNTLRALEEGLEEFAGCAVVISHDRWFLDRIATHILAFEGDSQVVFFEGGYTDYEENKKKRLGDVTPHRVKYKKLIKE